MNELQKNADRFKGFADVYDSSRPAMPLYPVKIIKKYLGKEPSIVVDLGCGTGLSSLVWRENCQKLYGIEPSDDMLREAIKKSDSTLEFIKGFGDDTTLPSDCADAVICSQSFHWMEPISTLNEVNRILKSGGVFATIDCDWPPVCGLEAERAYSAMYGKVKEYETKLPEVKSSFLRYPKSAHLKNITDSGYFRYTREIVFSNTESCTAERLFSLLMSQGSTQAILKREPELISNEIASFKKTLCDSLGKSVFEIEFSYRMRIGVK